MSTNVPLTPRQERALARLIEAASQVPDGEEDFEYWYLSTNDGDFSYVEHSKLVDRRMIVSKGDLRALQSAGLIDLWKEQPSHDMSHLVIRQAGFMYVEKGTLPLKEDLRQVVYHHIVNNHGGTMTNFYQQGQQVSGTQNNAGRDINISAVQNAAELVPLLEQLKAEVRQARADKVIEGEVVDDAEYQVQKAITEAGKENPDGGKILGYIKQAKEYITATNTAVLAGSTLITNFDKIQDLALKLFS